jgi:hypothetical protein
MGNPLHGPTLQDPQSHVILERPCPWAVLPLTWCDVHGLGRTDSTVLPLSGLMLAVIGLLNYNSASRYRVVTFVGAAPSKVFYQRKQRSPAGRSTFSYGVACRCGR